MKDSEEKNLMDEKELFVSPGRAGPDSEMIWDQLSVSMYHLISKITRVFHEADEAMTWPLKKPCRDADTNFPS